MTAENLAKILTPTLCDITDVHAVRRLDLLYKTIEDLIVHGEYFFNNGMLDEDKVLDESK